MAVQKHLEGESQGWAGGLALPVGRSHPASLQHRDLGDVRELGLFSVLLLQSCLSFILSTQTTSGLHSCCSCVLGYSC